jgi:hypothetical protein
MKTLLKTFLVVGVLAFTFAGASAHAATIDWNTWTSATDGTISTTGGSVTVAFNANGSADYLYASYVSYLPAATYADGTIVNNAPSSSNNIIHLEGGNANINTITFSTPVVNPVMVIWSLGNSSTTASFNFIAATPTLVAGGVSSEYGGSSITVSGNDVSGAEGNGTVEFLGTFSNISWTNPVYEDWYGFNVGITGTAATSVPEPTTMLLLGLGLMGLAEVRRKFKN